MRFFYGIVLLFIYCMMFINFTQGYIFLKQASLSSNVIKSVIYLARSFQTVICKHRL